MGRKPGNGPIAYSGFPQVVGPNNDFESERKWTLSQANKVALKASKGMLDQAMRGEKNMKVLISLPAINTIVYRKPDMVIPTSKRLAVSHNSLDANCKRQRGIILSHEKTVKTGKILMQ